MADIATLSFTEVLVARIFPNFVDMRARHRDLTFPLDASTAAGIRPGHFNARMSDANEDDGRARRGGRADERTDMEKYLLEFSVELMTAHTSDWE